MFNSIDKITAQLPVIFIDEPIMLPHNEYRFEVKGSINLSALKLAEQYQNQLVIVIRDSEKSTEGENKYYR